MAPLWVLDYVVVHELSHFKHMNHSKEFWDTVAMYLPDYKKAVQWLKENGGSLSLQLEKEEVCDGE
jgi:predicted metal-dependent hydrolase